jgi:hypothetical protein
VSVDTIANYSAVVNLIYQQLSTILAQRTEKKERLHAHILFSANVLVVSLRELNNRLKRHTFALYSIDVDTPPEERNRIASEFSSFVIEQNITPNIRKCVAELTGFLGENLDKELAGLIKGLAACGEEMLDQRRRERYLGGGAEFFEFAAGIRKKTLTEKDLEQVRVEAMDLSQTFDYRVVTTAEDKFGLLRSRILMKFPLLEVPL